MLRSSLDALPGGRGEAQHMCIAQLCGGQAPQNIKALDSIEQDNDRDQPLRPAHLKHVTKHSRNAALLDRVAPRCVLHFFGARVILTSNLYVALGRFNGCIGCVASYKRDGTSDVWLEHHCLSLGVARGLLGVHDAGEDWLEVKCPQVAFEYRIMACPGAFALPQQVPLPLGWVITVHLSQSLSLSEAVLVISQAFGTGMASAAIHRVSGKRGMYVKSFSGSVLRADPLVLEFSQFGTRL